MFDFGWNGEFLIEGGTPWGANDAPLVEYRWFLRRLLEDDGHQAPARVGCSISAIAPAPTRC